MLSNILKFPTSPVFPSLILLDPVSKIYPRLCGVLLGTSLSCSHWKALLPGTGDPCALFCLPHSSTYNMWKSDGCTFFPEGDLYPFSREVSVHFFIISYIRYSLTASVFFLFLTSAFIYIFLLFSLFKSTWIDPFNRNNTLFGKSHFSIRLPWHH